MSAAGYLLTTGPAYETEPEPYMNKNRRIEYGRSKGLWRLLADQRRHRGNDGFLDNWAKEPRVWNTGSYLDCLPYYQKRNPRSGLTVLPQQRPGERHDEARAIIRFEAVEAGCGRAIRGS